MGNASIFPAVLYTGSGDKWDFSFFYVFLFALGQYPFNVKKKKKNGYHHSALDKNCIHYL